MKIYKNIKTLLLGSLCAGLGVVGMTSCNNNEPADNGFQDSEKVYLELDLSLPFETRSTVNNDGSTSEGTESPFNNESKISSLQLVFCQAGADADNDTYLMSTGDLEGVIQASDNGKLVSTVKVPVDYKNFAEILNSKKIVVYAVANATANLNGNSPKDWKLSFNDFNSNGLGEWKGPDGNVVPLVSSERSAVLDFSGYSYFDMKNLFDNNERIYHLSQSSNAPQLGVVKMERLVARFDYKGNGQNNLYPLGETGMYLKIDGIQPVNVSKEAYLFRHTAEGNATGSQENVAKLFGNENGNGASTYNWIADTDWSTKNTTTGAPASGYFLNQPSQSGNDWNLNGVWNDVDALTSNTQNKDKYQNSDYHVWCYVTENTLPSINKMIEGLSTGIAFRAVLSDAQGNALTKTQLLNSSAPWAWTLAFEENGDQLTVSNLKSGTRNLQKVEGKDAYALTYLYWNRHNDVSKSMSVTDPMEFAVVRNHVYKISITALNGLPRVYNPEEPDELVEANSQDFNVSVAVEEWGYNQVEMDI